MKYLISILIMMTFFKKTNNLIVNESIYNIKINQIDGSPLNLSKFKGKKLLFVNVASECGFTGQYEDLQKLYELYQEKLMIVGVPCNQFGGQEPGTSEEIQTFCKQNYGVTFIITEKVDVKGSKQHPLYKWRTTKALNGKKSSSVKWNFQKYLVDENGMLIDYYYSITKPLSKKILNYLQ